MWWTVPDLVFHAGFGMVSCQNDDWSTPDEGVLDVTKRDRFELVSAYLDGEVTPAERLVVTNWLANDCEVQRLYRRLLMLRQAFRSIPTEMMTQISPVVDINLEDAAGASAPSGVVRADSDENASDQPLDYRSLRSPVAVSQPATLSQLSGQQHRFRTASLALAFTAVTLLVTSLTGMISGRILPWQLTRLWGSEVLSAPHVDDSSSITPELALDEPAIELPQEGLNDPFEGTIH